MSCVERARNVLRTRETKMHLYQIIAGLLFTSSAMFKPTNGEEGAVVFDFTRMENLNGWSESSDTVRRVGMSKAVLTLQKTQVFQRAIFLTILNPQPNGAGFAGMRTPVTWDLRPYTEFRMRCRGQGQNSRYKVVLRHRGESSNDTIEYEGYFEAPMSNETFSEVILPLDDFKPYFRGRESKEAEPLDRSRVTMFGFQIYGGVYSPFKQAGVSALEIENVRVTRRSKNNEVPQRN